MSREQEVRQWVYREKTEFSQQIMERADSYKEFVLDIAEGIGNIKNLEIKGDIIIKFTRVDKRPHRTNVTIVNPAIDRCSLTKRDKKKVFLRYTDMYGPKKIFDIEAFKIMKEHFDGIKGFSVDIIDNEGKKGTEEVIFTMKQM